MKTFWLRLYQASHWAACHINICRATMPPHGNHYPGLREHHVYCVLRNNKSTFCAPFRKGSEERTKWNPISDDLYSQHVNLLWWLRAKSVRPPVYLGRSCWESLCVIVTALIMFWLDNTKLCRLKTHGTRYKHCCVEKLKQIVSIWKMFEKFFGHFECVAHDAEVSPCWGAELQSKTSEGFADNGSSELLGARNSQN